MFDLASSNSVNLGLGEPDFQPPSHVVEALVDAVRCGHNKYAATLGIMELRDAFAKQIRGYRNGDVAAENIMVTVGASQGLMAINQTFVEGGDEVLVPNPGFVIYGPQARLSGGRAVGYSLTHENGFVPDIDELQSLITPKTKMMVMNTPGNPTGATMNREQIKAVVEIAEDKDIIIVADEVYDAITYDGGHNSFLQHSDNVIYVNSFSKTYAMTGWRLGCLATKKEYIDQLMKVHYYTVACPPTPLQKAAVVALTGPQDYVETMRKEYAKRRDYIVGRINDIEGFDCLKPGGAFYAFPKFDHDIEDVELSMRLAKEGLICTPGSAFGSMGRGHLRFAYSASLDNIARGMDILERVCKEIPLRK